MGISKANAQWEGGVKDGSGVMRPAHAAEARFAMGSRFEGEPASNPEELIGAALAGCFSMALTVALEQAGAHPRSVKTSAAVTLEKQGAGFTITGIQLEAVADAPGVEAAKFAEIAEVPGARPGLELGSHDSALRHGRKGGRQRSVADVQAHARAGQA